MKFRKQTEYRFQNERIKRRTFDTFSHKSMINVLLHINRKNWYNPLNKWIWLVEWIFHFPPGSRFFYDTSIIHFREILRNLWGRTIRQATNLTGSESINPQEKIDDLESTIGCKGTKNISHLNKNFFFLKHFILDFCKIFHNIFYYFIILWINKMKASFLWKIEIINKIIF